MKQTWPLQIVNLISVNAQNISKQYTENKYDVDKTNMPDFLKQPCFRI